MRYRKRIAAVAVALAVSAWSGPDAWGLPGPAPGPPPGLPPMAGGRPPGPPMGGRPPAPPMRGGRPPGPVMGPGAPRRLMGMSGPGGIGRPGNIGRPGSPGGLGGPVGRAGSPFDGGYGSGRPGAFGFGTTARPAGFGSPARSGLLPGNSPTAAVNRQALASQANLVRNNYNLYGAFNGDWWGQHAGAWRAAGWAAAAAYSYPTWGRSYGYCGYATDYPRYYDYGSNVVYERQYVYVNGDPVATQDQYAQQAKTIADAGKNARATPEDDWLPLGVFAMTQGGQVHGNDVFQLGVNKAGVIRGNYYAAISDSTLPVYGSVDHKTQRAAWTVGDREEPVFEAGFANLTKSETTILVHWGKDRAQQWNLVRIEQPPDKNPGVEVSGARPER